MADHSDQAYQTSLHNSNQQHHQSLKQHNLMNSGLSPHIVQNYSILAQEITAPMETKSSQINLNDSSSTSSSDFITKNWSSPTHVSTSSKGNWIFHCIDEKSPRYIYIYIWANLLNSKLNVKCFNFIHLVLLNLTPLCYVN